MSEQAKARFQATVVFGVAVFTAVLILYSVGFDRGDVGGRLNAAEMRQGNLEARTERIEQAVTDIHGTMMTHELRQAEAIHQLDKKVDLLIQRVGERNAP